MEMPFIFDGDFQEPDRTQGVWSTSSLTGEGVRFKVVIIGDTPYVRDPGTGEWHLETLERGPPFSRPGELIGIEVSEIEDLEFIGEETLYGNRAYHLRGIVEGETLTELIGVSEAVEGELQIEYWIGVTDALVRQVTLDGYFIPKSGENLFFVAEGTVTVAAILNLFELGKAVVIEAPE